MVNRYSKWFTVKPAGTTYGPANAVYNGQTAGGTPDPINEGVVGRSYSVFVLSVTKLSAPNPPFETQEGFAVTPKKLKEAKEYMESLKKRKKVTK